MKLCAILLCLIRMGVYIFASHCENRKDDCLEMNVSMNHFLKEAINQRLEKDGADFRLK